MLHKLIAQSTAARPAGLPAQDKLFRVRSGPFAGRLLAIFARTPLTLAWSSADAPYTSWFAPADVITDSADEPYAAVMDDQANVCVAYTQQTTGALRCVKLTFASGTWATQSPATVYDSAPTTNKYPSILMDLYGRLWIAWTLDDAGSVSLHVKKSLDDGLTFGAGAADAGTDLSGTATSAFGQLIARATGIHCLFTLGGTVLKNRDIDLDASIWNPTDTLYTGTGLNSDFSVAVAPDGTLGILFTADGSLFLKEHDGAVWGALQTVTAGSATSPALRYIGSVPYAFFLQSIGTDQRQHVESHRAGQSFTTPAGTLTQLSPFSSVLCFDAAAGIPYADMTVAAAGQAGADVYHPASGALLAQPSDALFLGLDDRFSLVRVLLSTAGVGGAVEWSYWNGAEWMTFTPYSGASDFDSANTSVRLFADTASAPADWQKTVVNGLNRYWIRVQVTTAFTVAPIGSQMTAVANSSDIIPLR